MCAQVSPEARRGHRIPLNTVPSLQLVYFATPCASEAPHTYIAMGRKCSSVLLHSKSTLSSTLQNHPQSISSPEMGKPTIPHLHALESWLLNIYPNSADKEPPHCYNASSGLGLMKPQFVLLNTFVIVPVLLQFRPAILWYYCFGVSREA